MLNILLSLLPGRLSVFFRRLLGAKIGKNAKLGFGSIILIPNKQLTIGKKASIRSFALVRGKKLSMGDYSSIAPFAKINVDELTMGKQTSVGTFSTLAGGKIFIDDHSKIFEYCYIDASRPVTIGKRVGIGGHNLIFTHGTWPNYLEGAPISFGEVTIEDNVWLPWRVFILPNVVIGKNSIIGANSLINKSIPENSLAAGTPASVIKQNVIQSSPEQRIQRAMEVIKTFREKFPSALNKIFLDEETGSAKEGDIIFSVEKKISESKREEYLRKKINVIDYTGEKIYLASDGKFCRDFIFHLTMYGIRLYLIEKE